MQWWQTEWTRLFNRMGARLLARPPRRSRRRILSSIICHRPWPRKKYALCFLALVRWRVASSFEIKSPVSLIWLLFNFLSTHSILRLPQQYSKKVIQLYRWKTKNCCYKRKKKILTTWSYFFFLWKKFFFFLHFRVNLFVLKINPGTPRS